MLIILTASTAVFLQLGLGGFLRKCGVLSPVADDSLNKLILGAIVPCFLFSNLLGNEYLDSLASLAEAPLVAMATVLLGFGMARLVAPLIGLRDPRMVGAFVATVMLYNYGYISYPLVETLFDEATMGAIILHNVGIELLLWTFIIILISGEVDRNAWKRIFNMPLFGVAAAVILTLALPAGVVAWLKATPVFKATSMLGACAIPMGLIMIGAFIYDALDRSLFREHRQIPLAAIGLRLLLIPIGMLVLMKILPVSIELKRVMVVQAAMPTAVFPILLSRHYGGHTPTAVRCFLSTAFVSFITMPLWIQFGLWWLGE